MLEKASLVEAKQAEHVQSERRLLAAIKSPFCARFVAAFQDAQRLYLLMEWVPGAHPAHMQGTKAQTQARVSTAPLT